MAYWTLPFPTSAHASLHCECSLLRAVTYVYPAPLPAPGQWSGVGGDEQVFQSLHPVNGTVSGKGRPCL